MEQLVSGVFLLAVISVVMAASEPWSIGMYPNPRSHPERCNRPDNRPSFVCDPDKILTTDQGMSPVPSNVKVSKDVHLFCWFGGL